MLNSDPQARELLLTWRLFVLEGGNLLGSFEAAQLLVRSVVTAEGDLVLQLR